MTGPDNKATGDSAVLDADKAQPGADADFVADRNRSFLSRLYTGTGAFEIVGRRRMWYGVTAAILLICLASIGIRGFTLGIDFEGGTQMSVPVVSSEITAESVEEVVTATLGEAPESVQTAGAGGSQTVQVRTETLDLAQAESVTRALADEFGPELAPAEVSISDVSSTWGSEITERMLIALAVFLVIVFVYIAVRFDREMSIAAMGSLFFDLIVTAGIYSLVGWEVTPATVIGLLTILGFSIYDTVVVFDKISENTRSVLQTTRRTYAEQANLGVNQTLMRSINTTVISVLPIIALMVIAVWLLGVGTLKDLGLIQLVGVLVGTFSSVFLAAPLLATLKERRPDIGRHTEKVLRRRAGLPSDEPRPVRTRRGASAGAAVDTDDADRAVPTGKRRRNR
ncbi:protein translocase subunit SecF [Gordonia sp. JH63]|uniref:Protein-export membrane protein SecF n=1 Tax=Gordonia hongkongensis TaxID=1701090 RepID=A0AAX3TCA8_9ACTN|nr:MULTISPECIES: protein translocase subunit SecF [Gordonia]QIK48206.1 protein translocase subunit SecF [Gordonia terrae]KSU60877.1 preprotein translocase subunit SecF [Gordonia sp. SGD-V-85]MBR7194841.1 protein translocase subunit SecF [Gordonia sp. SCSIO 19800]MCX2752543.1 protein translocase subunit SecF [Gordonia sp. 4N]MDT0220825.1 protein translocase subunit SecF [Gordonia sp. AC31]